MYYNYRHITICLWVSVLPWLGASENFGGSDTDRHSHWLPWSLVYDLAGWQKIFATQCFPTRNFACSQYFFRVDLVVTKSFFTCLANFLRLIEGWLSLPWWHTTNNYFMSMKAPHNLIKTLTLLIFINTAKLKWLSNLKCLQTVFKFMNIASITVPVHR